MTQQVRLPPLMLATHIIACIPDPAGLLQIQLPVNVGKKAEDGPCNPFWRQGWNSRLWPGPDQAAAVICGVNQWIEYLSLSLYHSAFQPDK